MHVMAIADIGAEHSTGNHLCRALEANGHTVTRINERPEMWVDGRQRWGRRGRRHDFVIWNSTPGYAPPETYDNQLYFLQACKDAGTPVVGYHLDLFWGLPERERWVYERPFFRSDLVITADGGHDERWEAAGVNHVWFPPAVLAAECVPGTFREEYAADVAFVGSWVPGVYHRRSKHRQQLIRWLEAIGLRRDITVKFWPEEGQPAIRGADLRDLYASTKVVVGDSCMVPHLKNYWSDRVPETTGRGGLLVHPEVDGLLDQHFHVFRAGWQTGNWEELDAMIGRLLDDPDRAWALREQQQSETLARHTYEIRMNQLVELLQKEEML